MVDPSESLLEQMEIGTHIINLIINTDKRGKAAHTFEFLSNKLQIFESYWTTVSKQHGQVCRENAELKQSHEYFMSGLYYEYEDAYVQTKTELASRMALLTKHLGNNPGSCSSGMPTIQMLPQPLRLPALRLPTFSGEQRDWASFKELFCSMVKDAPHIANVQKLQRLLSCLEGKAASRVKNMAQLGSNFEVAWNTLLQSYDNKRVKLADHLKRLLTMPVVSQKSSCEITRLLDTVEEAIRSMISLDRPVDHWDDWLVQLVKMRLDSDTRENWKKSIESQNDFPRYADLKVFLENRCRTLVTAGTMEAESIKNITGSRRSERSGPAFQKTHNKPHGVHTVQVTGQVDDKSTKIKLPCALCQGKYFLSYCLSYLNYDNSKRWSFVKQAGLCSNCSRPKHASGGCPSNQRCRIKQCNGLHHTSLHSEKLPKPALSNSTSSNESSMKNTQVVSTLHSSALTVRVTLLATARVILETDAGECLLVRALLDPGSEVSLVSERVVQALRLVKRRSCTHISGVGDLTGPKAVGEVDIYLKSPNAGHFKLHLTALVSPRLTASLPGQTIERCDGNHIRGLQLADPNYCTPGGVDCLLGADVYPLLLLDGIKRGGEGQPLAQSTVFGWVIISPVAPIPRTSFPRVAQCNHASTSCSDLREELRRFWELEEVPLKPFISAEDQECENHFSRSHSRDASGRYVLRLPFSRPSLFPDSYDIAKTRLLSSEKRHQKKTNERQAHVTFMKDYEDMNHMERIQHKEIESSRQFYISHHAVLRSDGSNKIKVVFNASQPAKNGTSLNDCLFAGPKLQTDITVILTRWHFHRVVFSADIVKMFRQFRIHPDDADWLRIVWRNSPEQAIKHFRLSTVTYGTACAPLPGYSDVASTCLE